MKSFILSTAALGITAASAQAAVVYDEAVDGGLSNDPLAPTVIDFNVGDNTVIGNTGPGNFPPPINPGLDAFTFTIEPGEQLTGIFLDGFTPDAPANTTGMVLFDGNQGSGSTFTFIGGGGFGTGDIGSNIGQAIVTDPAGAGLSLPLGPGDYTFETREFGGQTDWEVRFTVVPAPGAAGLLGLAGLAAARRRR